MASHDWVGKSIGERYRIDAFLGDGGMAAVYKANDPNLRRDVAIKLIHPHLSRNAEFVRRFEEEATAVARLRHPHIVQVHDFDNDNGTYYIVFEFVAGESLQAVLRQHAASGQPFSIERAQKVCAHIGEALAYAHEEGLVHRDIKPANIMFNQRGAPILMDFGIAKVNDATQATATGMVLGTARYMSPEQVMGEKVDARTDIYALGVMLFEMVSGRPPFEADSVATLMMKHLNAPVPDVRELRPDVSPGLIRVINKALAKDKAERFQTAGEMVAALRELMLADSGVATARAEVVEKTVLETAVPPSAANDRTVVETRKTTPDPVGTPKRPWLLIGGAVVAVLLVVVALFALRPAAEEPAASRTPVVASSNVSLSAGGNREEASGEETAVLDVAGAANATPTSAAMVVGAESEPETAVQTPPFDPLFLTTYGHEGLIVGLALPAQDTERVLFSIDNPQPSIDNGRTTAGTTTIANNSIGPIPHEKGEHTLYVQYIGGDDTPSEIYEFEYHIDDIVFNFSQQPYDFEMEGIPAIVTMAVVGSDPDALYTYAYSVDSQALSDSVQGVGQAGVINLTRLEPGDHVLYVQASGAGGETAVVAYPFTIE